MTVVLMTVITSFVQAKVIWSSEEIDFGTFDESQGMVKKETLLVNTGSNLVVINDIRPGCGCTSAFIEPDELMPGDTARLIVTYNPAGRPGQFRKKVKVFLSGEMAPKDIVIKGTVIGSPTTLDNRYPEGNELLRLDQSVVLAGKIKRGQRRQRVLEVYNPGPDSIKPVIKGLPEEIDVKFQETVLAPGEKTEISITICPTPEETYGRKEYQFFILPCRVGEDTHKTGILQLEPDLSEGMDIYKLPITVIAVIE